MSSRYGWVITRDFIASNPQESDAGVIGPSTIPFGITQRLKAGEGKKFRMFDDDGELYYEGLIIGELTEDSGDPLSDFGDPNAGCTLYKEYENGKWIDVIS